MNPTFYSYVLFNWHKRQNVSTFNFYLINQGKIYIGKPVRIVLIQPPIEDFYTTSVRLQPIGLAYLKATIKAYFTEVDVIVRDYNFGHGKRSIAWPKELAFLKPYYPFADRSPFSTFYHYYHFGASYEIIVRDVAELNPDLIGISVLFSAYAPQAFEMARLLKEYLNVPILMGGSHVSAVPQEVLSLPFVDFVILGEGERPMTAFVDALSGKKHWQSVPNLGFKQNGTLKFTTFEENFNLDEIPFPDFSDFTTESYRHRGRNLSFVVSSRSCPYRCAFCSVHQTFGLNFRSRSVENIMAELKLRRSQGYLAFDFEDDNLTFDQKRMRLLTEALQTEFKGDDIRLMAMNGVAYFRLTKEILLQMRAAGFRDLNISLVSINEQLLRRLKRPYHFGKFQEMVQFADQLKMNVVSYQILGLPGDTLPSMLQTLIYQSRLPLTIGVSPFYFTPEMPIGNSDFIEKPFWVLGRLTSLGLRKNPNNRDAVYTLFILARMVNFLKHLSGITKNADLLDLLANKDAWQGRERLGLVILERLLKEKILYGFTGNEFRPLPRFRFEIFKAFLKQVDFITRPGGGTIKINDRW